MRSNYVYSLRIGICPDFYPEEKFGVMLKFCDRAKIDDIQFFLNMEDLNQGHLTVEETKKWLAMLARFKPLAEERGYTVSLNPWTTVLHEDRGRKLRPDQHFTLMTDLSGRRAEAVACPLDEKFRDYLTEIYRLYAELGFNTIWLEDDFRLHNHGPLEWGGCFCELHREEFSRRAGKGLSLTEFSQAFSQEGEPHPYRKIWLETACDTMAGLAERLGETVHQTAPQTRIGLMSSAPESHCVEGRDWERMLKAISGPGKPLNRPHLPGYNDMASIRYAIHFQRFSRLTAAVTKGLAELWPEVENFPHSRFSKSHRFTKLQIESTLALCAGGITLNLFDMIGNGVNPSQEYDKVLAEIKPYLNGVTGLSLSCAQEQGVHVLYSSRSSYTIHSTGGNTPDAIKPRETFWAEFLSALGIANRYCDNPSITGKTVAVSGQYFRNLSAEQIERLFAENFLLLDGEAAFVLHDMGLGHLVHITSVEWYPVNTGRHSYEQVSNGRRYQNFPEARMTGQSFGRPLEPTDYLRIDYDAEPRETITRMKAPDGSDVGNGVICFGNKVLILPYGHMGEQYSGLLNPIRQEILQQHAARMPKAARPVMLRGCPYVAVNHFTQEGREVLLLTNYSNDDYASPLFSLPCSVDAAFEVSRTDGGLMSVSMQQNGEDTVFSLQLQPLESRCLVLERRESQCSNAVK